MQVTFAVAIIALTGCDALFRIDHVEELDAPMDSVDVVDGNGRLDAALPDTLPSDGCLTHAACAMQVAGTCCVTPGATTGHCETGTIVGGSCYVP